MTVYSIHKVDSDEFGVVPGPGWVVHGDGKRLDWPMLTTKAEALKDCLEFAKEERALAAEELSELRGLLRMGGQLD